MSPTVFTRKHLHPQFCRTFQHPILTRWSRNLTLEINDDTWVQISSNRGFSCISFSFFKQEFFPPFSLASGWVFSGMWGGEGGLLRTCRSFTTFHELFQQREKRFKGGGGGKTERENLQNVSVRQEKEEWVEMRRCLWFGTDLAERRCETITNGDHQSVHQF